MTSAAADTPERIAKRIARSGLCSRRDAERWIAAGRVAVDGDVLSSPALTVTAANLVTVDGEPLPQAEHSRIFRFHKPTGVVTAARDPGGRKTIYDRLPEGLPRLMPIGRLDLTSEGLLLLTNDGELKRRLELPATGWQRRYRVRVHGRVDPEKLAALKRGIKVEGFDYGPIEASLERRLGKNAWLNVALREGKNREIRKVMEHFGWPVNRLIRISFGPFHLGNLAKGDVDEIKTKVVKEQVGLVLRSTTPARQRRLKGKSKRPSAVKKDDRLKAGGEASQKPKASAKKILKLKTRHQERKNAQRAESRPAKRHQSEQPRAAPKASSRRESGKPPR